MSTPATPTTPSAESSALKDADRRRSLGKYVKRMSSVFKRDKPATAAPAGAASASSPAPAASPAPATTTEQAPAAKATSPPASTPAAAAKSPPAPVVSTHELNRGRLQQERARALFAKYGLTLESHEWLTSNAQPISVQRIERPIRMRVHRTCHHCGSTFGADKVCSSCEHRRCKKCPRYPQRKDPAAAGKQSATAAAAAAATPKKKKKALALTNKAGDERVYQPIKQRIRRSCHKCDAFFIPPTASVCDECRHVRCVKCPREPAKLNKWPNGYPGDADASDTQVDDLTTARRIWRKPRTRVRWECDECQSQFIDGSPQCPGCGHERCEKCTRRPLKKSKHEKQFDPAVIRAVEEKLRALKVDEDTLVPPAQPIEAT